MFKFDFDIDDEGDENLTSVPTQTGSGPVLPASSEAAAESSASGAARYRKISLDQLIDLLPPAISFSPLVLRFPPTPASAHEDATSQREEITILRRDLYDARFQILEDQESSDDEDEDDGGEQDIAAGQAERPDAISAEKPEKEDQKYVDAETDLIPGTYEGGLKTWEGGMDLVDVLQGFEQSLGSETSMDGNEKAGLGGWIAGKRILEIGCGTALPSLYLLQKIVAGSQGPSEPDASSPPSPSPPTVFHLQDYNLSVLHLVTLPNIILSVLPISYIQSHATPSNDLELSEELLNEFKRILEVSGVQLEFTYGDWAGFGRGLSESETDEQSRVAEKKFDLMMTAETIYRQESVDSLIRVLKNGIGQSTKEAAPSRTGGEPDLAGLRIRSDPVWTLPLTLVAAKILYFGVGGGIRDFLDRVKAEGGTSEDVKVWSTGVGRKVVRLDW